MAHRSGALSGTLETDSLDAFYGGAQALFGVSIAAPPGKVVGVLGRNGAGKTTLLRCLVRAHRGIGGRIRLGEADLAKASADRAASAGLSLVREGAQVFEALTVDDHLGLARRLAERRGRDPGTAEGRAFELFPVLASRRDTQAGLLSGGQRQMLAFATAYVSCPTVFLLDEPSAGLAPTVAAELFGAVRELVDHDVAVVLTEQNPRWLEGVVDRLYLLETGRVEAERDGDDLPGLLSEIQAGGAP